jgi:uncharacterized damage-inducible protein DinB
MLGGMEHATDSSLSSPTPTQSQAHTSLDVGPDATGRARDLMLSLMRYKSWADADLIKAALALPTGFPAKEAGYIIAIIRHYHTVDCIFRAHLLGIPHDYTSPNPPEPATLSELQQRVREIDQWYVDYASELDECDFGEVLSVRFTDGAEQTLTRSDILLHVSQHGTGHRGQVSLFIKLYGVEPPPDRITNYLRNVSQHA